IQGFKFAPESFSIGIRTMQCHSLAVEECHFRFVNKSPGFWAGLLIQGDNGKIRTDQCRFTALPTNSGYITVGVCLAPILKDVQGSLQSSSIEILQIESCVFALLTTGILLTSRPLLVSIANNVTRAMHSSLFVLWHDDKIRSVRDVFELMQGSV